PKPQWQAVFRQMMGLDLIRPDAERHGAFRMTEAARPILRGEAKVTLRRDTIRKAVSKPTVRMQVSDEDAPLLSALKAKRRALAEAARVPAYVIFPDRTLIEMAEKRPSTLDEMARVNGVGAKKLESFGAAFLEVIIGAGAEDMHPARRKLAGRGEGAVFDQLMEAQALLLRGEDGAGKYLTCPPATLKKIAEARPRTLAELERIAGVGSQKAERFGPTFLDILTAV
ncbi:MAG: HRDC domain-containing protein, partial [Albidovulum sp.]